MKKTIAAVLFAVIIFSLSACVGVKEQKTSGTRTQEQTAAPDADWILPETIEMTEDVRAVFDKAMEGLMGVNYEPLGYLAEKDGVYCILCRAAVVYPDAKPYYALVYVSDEGLVNIWDIWMGAHAQKAE